jgi:serine phosphatase RsbU (regulator of sigma subunit)
LQLQVGDKQRLMLADGIGHGATAHRIVTTLADYLTELSRANSPPQQLDDCLRHMDHLLHQQAEGAQAAVALVDVDPETEVLEVAVVGNLQVHYLTPKLNIHFPSMLGMVGGRFPRQVLISRSRIHPASLLALFSDGLDSAGACAYLSDLRARSTQHSLRIQSEVEIMLSRFGHPSDDASCALLWFAEAS